MFVLSPCAHDGCEDDEDDDEGLFRYSLVYVLRPWPFILWC